MPRSASKRTSTRFPVEPRLATGGCSTSHLPVLLARPSQTRYPVPRICPPTHPRYALTTKEGVSVKHQWTLMRCACVAAPYELYVYIDHCLHANPHGNASG